MYIVRANQAVMIALNPSIPISTAAFNNNSFKPCVSPASSSDNSAHVRNRNDMLHQLHPGTTLPHSRQLLFPYSIPLKEFAYVLTFRAIGGKGRSSTTQVVEEISRAMLELALMRFSGGRFLMWPADFANTGRTNQEHVRHCRKVSANVRGRR